MPLTEAHHLLWPALYAAAFLAGSIPTGLIIGRAKGIDIRQHGSGNIGATNVMRVLGPGPGGLCFVIDIAKGLLPTLAAGLVLGRLGQLRMSAGDAWIWLGAMLMPVLGHVFCPWLKFKGGKGVATGLGVMLGLFPAMAIPGVLVALTWLVVFAARRYVSLASLASGLSLPAWTLAIFWFWPASRGASAAGRAADVDAGGTGSAIGGSTIDAAYTTSSFPPEGSAPFLIVSLALAVLVFWTHRSNIKRLLAGTELRAGKKKGQTEPPSSPDPLASPETRSSPEPGSEPRSGARQ